MIKQLQITCKKSSIFNFYFLFYIIQQKYQIIEQTIMNQQIIQQIIPNNPMIPKKTASNLK